MGASVSIDSFSNRHHRSPGSSVPTELPGIATGPLRLVYLDGLRGLAALYVVLHHLHREITYRLDLPHAVLVGTKWLQLGHCAVDVFIVLSGYSLMLPIARSGRRRLDGGFKTFVVRRARRILPPYYAALLMTMIIVLATPSFQTPVGWRSDGEIPSSITGSVLSHLVLLHNLSPGWCSSLNSPMWSIAVEAQIYLLFPLLLLPIWRVLGLRLLIASALVLGLAPHFLFSGNADYTIPWYIGLFAMGMAGAVVGFSIEDRLVRVQRQTPWIYCALLMGGGAGLITKMRPDLQWVIDPMVGAATVCFIADCTRHFFMPCARRPLVLRVLEARWAVFLGTISYSLYLTHSPLISLVHLGLRRLHPSPIQRLVILPILVLPSVFVVALLFHLCFERPFLSLAGRPRAVVGWSGGAEFGASTTSPVEYGERPEGAQIEPSPALMPEGGP